MKVAINIEHFTEDKGGAERYAFGLASALTGRGHEVHILTSFWHKCYEKKFHFHKIPFSRLRIFRDIKFVRASQRELLKENFDLCLAFSRSLRMEIYQPHGGVHRAYLEKKIKSYSNPLIMKAKLFFNAISLRHFLIKKIERVIFKRRDIVVIAVSKMVRQDILAFYDFPEENIKVIYNGVDLKKFCLEGNSRYRTDIRKRYSLKDEDLLILFVANNFRLKGLKNLVYAAVDMKKNICAGNSFRILVMGDGGKMSYQRLASKLGCKNEFVFVGKINEMEKYYAAADVLAQPTFYDPCSLATMEAMASGLPVVTTSNNGAGELINGENGFVLDNPQNYKALSKKLMLFLNKDLRRNMGLNARRTIENYSVHENTNKMISVCEEVSRNKRKK